MFRKASAALGFINTPNNNNNNNNNSYLESGLKTSTNRLATGNGLVDSNNNNINQNSQKPSQVVYNESYDLGKYNDENKEIAKNSPTINDKNNLDCDELKMSPNETGSPLYMVNTQAKKKSNRIIHNLFNIFSQMPPSTLLTPSTPSYPTSSSASSSMLTTPTSVNNPQQSRIQMTPVTTNVKALPNVSIEPVPSMSSSFHSIIKSQKLNQLASGVVPTPTSLAAIVQENPSKSSHLIEPTSSINSEHPNQNSTSINSTINSSNNNNANNKDEKLKNSLTGNIPSASSGLQQSNCVADEKIFKAYKQKKIKYSTITSANIDPQLHKTIIEASTPTTTNVSNENNFLSEPKESAILKVYDSNSKPTTPVPLASPMTTDQPTHSRNLFKTEFINSYDNNLNTNVNNSRSYVTSKSSPEQLNEVFNEVGSVSNDENDYSNVSFIRGANGSNGGELYLNDKSFYKKEAGSVCEFLTNKLENQQQQKIQHQLVYMPQQIENSAMTNTSSSSRFNSPSNLFLGSSTSAKINLKASNDEPVILNSTNNSKNGNNSYYSNYLPANLKSPNTAYKNELYDSFYTKSNVNFNFNKTAIVPPSTSIAPQQQLSPPHPPQPPARNKIKRNRNFESNFSAVGSTAETANAISSLINSESPGYIQKGTENLIKKPPLSSETAVSFITSPYVNVKSMANIPNSKLAEKYISNANMKHQDANYNDLNRKYRQQMQLDHSRNPLKSSTIIFRSRSKSSPLNRQFEIIHK
jgi:hypothetical protein